jgi:V-type H+-transporting ATPase subunit E
MSDSQVDTELRKMTAFIRQEALEKAREIHLKADEEFSIEKSKLVRQETQRIDAEYEKKHTQAGMSQQITASTLANRQRLRVLGSKQELLDGLFEQAGKKLAETVGAGEKGTDYESVVKGLVLEGLYALVESKVSVRCRKKDVEVVKKAIEGAKKEYADNLKGREVEVTVDEKENLPEESYVYTRNPYKRYVLLTNTLTEPAASSSSTAPARSKSTTPSKSASSCSRPTPCPQSASRCSARTRTVASRTRRKKTHLSIQPGERAIYNRDPRIERVPRQLEWRVLGACRYHQPLFAVCLRFDSL